MPDVRSRLEPQGGTLTTLIDRSARQRAIPMEGAILLTITDIRRDGGTQPRAKLDKKLIADYAEDMQAGAEFPPVDVFYDGEIYWLADGYHRVSACIEAGLTQVAAFIHQGTVRDAILFSVGVNAEHGRRRTNEDKRRAVMKLLHDPEWARWGDREIARRCKVHHDMVGDLRASLSKSASDSKQDYDSLADSASEKQAVTYTSKSGRQTVMATDRIRQANVERPKPAVPSFIPDDFDQTPPDEEPFQAVTTGEQPTPETPAVDPVTGEMLAQPTGNYQTPGMQRAIRLTTINHLRSDAKSLRRIGDTEIAELCEQLAAYGQTQWELP